MRAITFLLALIAVVFAPATNAQSTFSEVNVITGQWSPRGKSNVEFITGSKSFRHFDGVRIQQVTLNNYFLLYGGQDSNGGLNDVWVGHANGQRWYFVAGITRDLISHPDIPDTFTPAAENGHAMDARFRQYRAGGIYSGAMSTEVWSSPDGLHWDLVNSDPGWSPRYFPNLICDHRNYVFLAGGITAQGGNPRSDSNEVWRSTDNGRNWIPMEMQNPDRHPLGRGVAIMLASGSIWGTDPVLLWMTGVDTAHANPASGDDPLSYLADIWASTNSGRAWSAVTLSATFGRRDDSNAEITSGGLIVLAGGYAGSSTREVYNDVWVSANGGYSWGNCVTDAEWEDRRYLMTVLDNNGVLWIMGGDANGLLMSDIWKSTWSLNDNNAVAQRCKVSIPSCGTGLKCWPGEKTTLVSTDGSSVYCDACPYNTGSSTAATLVIVFLVIFLIGFIITGGLLAYTYYKLRSAGAPSPIPLPASAQAWWNKSTSGSVNGTTDSASTNGSDIYQPLRIRDQV